MGKIEDQKVNNILAAITLEEYSKPALIYASFLSKKLNASLYILNVVNKRAIEAASIYNRLVGSSVPVEMEEYKKLLIQFAKDKVNEILKENELSNIKAEIAIKIGEPVEEIIKYINENNIDLGVLARSGREKDMKLIKKTGSVADNIFRNASIPILFI